MFTNPHIHKWKNGYFLSNHSDYVITSVNIPDYLKIHLRMDVFASFSEHVINYCNLNHVLLTKYIDNVKRHIQLPRSCSLLFFRNTEITTAKKRPVLVLEQVNNLKQRKYTSVIRSESGSRNLVFSIGSRFHRSILHTTTEP